MRGLLVEDERGVAEGLKRLFKRLDLELEHVITLAHARERLAKHKYDFLILDRCLPDGDSIELSKEQRAKGDCCYIAFLSGLLVAEEDCMETYDAGGDFSFLKTNGLSLFATHVKRSLETRSGTRAFGPLRLDALLHRVHFPDGTFVTLTEQEARFLITVSNCAPRPATEKDLIDAVWEGRMAHDPSAVSGVAKRAKDKLGEFKWLVRVVHGEGSYQLVTCRVETAPAPRKRRAEANQSDEQPVARPRVQSGVVNRETGEFLPGQMEALDGDAEEKTKRGKKR